MHVEETDKDITILEFQQALTFLFSNSNPSWTILPLFY